MQFAVITLEQPMASIVDEKEIFSLLGSIYKRIKEFVRALWIKDQ